MPCSHTLALLVPAGSGGAGVQLDHQHHPSANSQNTMPMGGFVVITWWL